MITLVSMREKTWFHGATEKALWSHLARAYGANWQLVDYLDELDEKPVIFDERGEIALEDYRHRESGVYFFGSTHQNRILESNHCLESVRIRYPGECCLFGIQAAAIAMADRRGKEALWQ